MNDPAIGVAIVNLLTFLGICQWLMDASWRGSRVKSGIIIACAGLQIVVIALAVEQASTGLALASLLLCIGYAIAGYVGAQKYERRNGNV